MARQIIESSLEIHLPKYEGKVSELLDNHSQVSVPFEVAPKQVVVITEVSVEENFENIPVDIIGHVGTHSFIIYFTHPEREIPLELREPANKKCGILEIALDKTHTLFNTPNSHNQRSYKETLLSYLKNDLSSKKWIFHPRYEAIETAAKNELLKRVATENEKLAHMFLSNTQAHSRNTFETIQPEDHVGNYYDEPREFSDYQEPERKPAKYECAICHVQWVGVEPGKNLCPKCKSHLYSKFLTYV